MVESMSCGTPVLANSVGSIPDHIRDGDNGFLMENNDPLTICTNLDRVLTRNDLERVSINAKNYSANQFSKKRAIEMWKLILD